MAMAPLSLRRCAGVVRGLQPLQHLSALLANAAAVAVPVRHSSTRCNTGTATSRPQLLANAAAVAVPVRLLATEPCVCSAAVQATQALTRTRTAAAAAATAAAAAATAATATTPASSRLGQGGGSGGHDVARSHDDDGDEGPQPMSRFGDARTAMAHAVAEIMKDMPQPMSRFGDARTAMAHAVAEIMKDMPQPPRCFLDNGTLLGE